MRSALHCHSFPPCECGVGIGGLLDTLTDTIQRQERDLAAIQQRLAEVERELKVAEIRAADFEDRLRVVQGQRDALRADLGRAVEALDRYGEHDSGCPQCMTGVVVFGAPRFEQSCTCGLDTALSPHPTPTTPGTAGEASENR